MSFSIQLNEIDMANVRATLQGIPGLAERVIRNSVNKTLGGVKTDVSTAVRTVIVAKKAKVDQSILVVPATLSNSGGKVVVKGYALQFSDFDYSSVAAGISVKIYKAEPRKVYAGAFEATVKAGVKLDGSWGGVTHTGVLKREFKGKHVGYKVRKPWPKFKKEIRFPIRAMFGPHVATILESHKSVFDGVMGQAEWRLAINLEREITYQMSKL